MEACPQMKTCPKCGGGQIVGPRYIQSPSSMGYFKDALRYCCFRCGYQQDFPCLDAEKTVFEKIKKPS
jgi:ribosomal protein S27AE